jgi:hypothetical protein
MKKPAELPRAFSFRGPPSRPWRAEKSHIKLAGAGMELEHEIRAIEHSIDWSKSGTAAFMA